MATIRQPAARVCAAVFVLAACVPTPAHTATYLVGAGAVPAECHASSIQAAIDAAAANPGEDFIRIASDQTYTGVALSIGQQDVSLRGGYASCSAAAPPAAQPTGNTILSGSGGAAAPVVRIAGSGVRVLENLQIRNGDNVQADGTGCGGGVRFEGRGELRLANVGISQNDADSGGGLCAVGTAQPTAITLGTDVSISSNTAATGDGGGIVVAGQARLFALADRTLIAFNEALQGYGGGLALRPPASADIGSPGSNGTAVLFGNTARRGGAISGVATGNDDGCLRLFTTDARYPVRLQANRASEAGGALYLTAYLAQGEAGAVDAYAYDFVIDGNTAPNGPAMFLQGDSSIFSSGDIGPRVALNSFAANCHEPVAELGAVRCNAEAGCNRIDDNHARNLAGQPTNGNVIEMRVLAFLSGQTVTLRGNGGTRLMSWSEGGESDSSISLFRSRLVENALTQELFRAFNEGEFRLVDTTIAGNAIGNTHLLRHDTDNVTMLRSLVVEQPGTLTLAHPSPGSLDVDNTWVLATDTTTLRPDPTLVQAPARFVDPERGDYRLRVGSQGVDMAPAPQPPTANDVDLDGRARNVDLENVTANQRARDVGAYERQLDDPWVTNGDFVADLRLWTNHDPAHATWDGSANAPGSVGGSLLFSVPAEQVGPSERRTALSYCFNVPSAGDYQVLGRALVAVPSGNRDYPVLAWRVRYASADCQGPESASGQSFFGRSGSNWQTFPAPLIVTIDPAQWTWNTTIELRLDVAQDPASMTATSLFARFDEIEIFKPAASNALFRDGFESL